MLLHNWDVQTVGEPLVLFERAIEVVDDVVGRAHDVACMTQHREHFSTFHRDCS